MQRFCPTCSSLDVTRLLNNGEAAHLDDIRNFGSDQATALKSL